MDVALSCVQGQGTSLLARIRMIFLFFAIAASIGSTSIPNALGTIEADSLVRVKGQVSTVPPRPRTRESATQYVLCIQKKN